MKKFNYILILLFSLLVFNINVKAEEYTCKYTFTESNGWGGEKTSKFEYTVNSEDNDIELPDRFGAIIDFAVDPLYEEYVTCDGVKCKVNDVNSAKKVLIESIMQGNCARTVYLCMGPNDDIIKSTDGVLFNTQYSSSMSRFDVVDNINGGNLSFYRPYDVQKSCLMADIDESGSTGEIVDHLVDTCVFYEDTIKDLRSKYDQCNGEASCLSVYNEKKEILRAFCSNVLKTGDYGLNPCVEKCLYFSSDIQDIEGFTIVSNECGVSDRVIKFISNILKWGKYIAPVLVIIFGIMDFIKAIASQSDDDMKKAQSRFIKRLIVAALIFIVPFLIEFVLNSFNIVSDDPYCNIL